MTIVISPFIVATGMGQQRAGGQLLGSGDDSGSAERRTEESRRRLGGSGRAQSENGRPDSRRVAN